MKKYLLYVFLFFLTALSAQNKVTHTYAVKGVDTLQLDVYSPENLKLTDSLPVLLWMHGGGFSGGTRDNKAEMELCEFATNKGYIGVSISYRLLRKNKLTGFGCDCSKEEKLETFKQAAIDYLDAANYLITNAKTLHIDSSKIIAGGSSAGAEAVLNAVYMREYFADDIQKYKNVKFAGVFSLAGAVLDASYITKHNALPTVMFHGTEDNLVPFGNASHHYCEVSKVGYLRLDGSSVIAEKLDDLETAYYFHIEKGGRHELSSIPFNELDTIFHFFDQTVLNNDIIQTKIIQTKTE